MIYFCFIEGDAQHDIEMTLLEAIEDGPAMQEARALRFSGRTGYVFDGDRPVGSVETSREPAPDQSLLAGSTTNRSARLSHQARTPDRSTAVARAQLYRSLPVARQALKPGISH